VKEKMQIEVRADGTAKITGYVNVTEKKSRPIYTPRGQVVEEIEPRAFEGALKRAGNVELTKDHLPGALAETRAGTLKLREDAIGLYAEAELSDPQTVEECRAGKVKGWSFGMRNVEDTLEERGKDLPLRRIKSLDLDHITLVVQKTPCHAATSLEVRADETVPVEERALDGPPVVTEEPRAKEPPTAAYRKRLESIKDLKED